jgi:predicted lipid-binding transport protein (Tim44 family)
MHLLYFVLSIGAMITALFAELTVGGVVFLVLMSAIFLLLGAWTLLSARFESSRRPERQIISPDELRAYREQAEQAKARKAAESEQSPPP